MWSKVLTVILALPSLGLVAPEALPQRTCTDARPYYIHIVVSAISKWENCFHNKGCLKYAGQTGAHRGRNGYAVFESDEASVAAIYRQIERRQEQPIGEVLSLYNPANPHYAEKILAGTGVDPGLIIGDQADCEVR